MKDSSEFYLRMHFMKECYGCKKPNEMKSFTGFSFLQPPSKKKKKKKQKTEIIICLQFYFNNNIYREHLNVYYIAGMFLVLYIDYFS